MNRVRLATPGDGPGHVRSRASICLAFNTLGMEAERPSHRRMIGELQTCPHNLAMRNGLIVHLDLPGAVVRHDEKLGRFVTRGGIDLDRIEAKRAVPGRNEDRSIREGQTGGDPIGHADADAAERPRIEHCGRAEADSGEAEEIATVSDDDGILSNRLLQRPDQLVGASGHRCRAVHSPSTVSAAPPGPRAQRAASPPMFYPRRLRLPAVSTNARRASLGVA